MDSVSHGHRSLSSLSPASHSGRSKMHFSVRVNVYDLHPANAALCCLGCGVYHSGVQITAVEPQLCCSVRCQATGGGKRKWRRQSHADILPVADSLKHGVFQALDKGELAEHSTEQKTGSGESVSHSSEEPPPSTEPLSALRLGAKADYGSRDDSGETEELGKSASAKCAEVRDAIGDEKAVDLSVSCLPLPVAFDTEYGYGGNPFTRATGVFSNTPGETPGGAPLRQSLQIKSLEEDFSSDSGSLLPATDDVANGKCCKWRRGCWPCCGRRLAHGGLVLMSMARMDNILDQFRARYLAKEYDVLTRNCNHFTQELVHALTGNSLPAWVNRAANVGSCCSCLLPERMRRPLLSMDPTVFFPKLETEEEEVGGGDYVDLHAALRKTKCAKRPRKRKKTTKSKRKGDFQQLGHSSASLTPPSASASLSSSGTQLLDETGASTKCKTLENSLSSPLMTPPIVVASDSRRKEARSFVTSMPGSLYSVSVHRPQSYDVSSEDSDWARSALDFYYEQAEGGRAHHSSNGSQD